MVVNMRSERQSGEVWAVGEGYESYVGRWSRQVAREFVDWLGVPAGARWLDVGCGTGALIEAVLERAPPAAVSGIDRSEGYVQHLRARLRHGSVELRTGDAQDLPYEDKSFEAVISGLVLNFVPDAAKMVAEMARVVRPGGIVAAYVWDYAGEMQLMRRFWDAAAALDARAAELDEGQRFPICRPEPLRQLFASTGLGGVNTRAIDIATVFRDFDDYWSPFLSGEGPAPGYCVSLSEERRLALRERLRETLPVERDGSIHLVARAWAVRGTKPDNGGK